MSIRRIVLKKSLKNVHYAKFFNIASLIGCAELFRNLPDDRYL